MIDKSNIGWSHIGRNCFFIFIARYSILGSRFPIHEPIQSNI